MLLPAFPVSRPIREVIIIGLDVGSQVDTFTGLQHLGAVYLHGVAVVVSAFKRLVESRGADGLGDMLATLGRVRLGDFVLGEDGLERAFWNAGAAVDAGYRVDVVPGILILGHARYDAFHWANIHAAAISQAQTGNNMGHF